MVAIKLVFVTNQYVFICPIVRWSYLDGVRFHQKGTSITEMSDAAAECSCLSPPFAEVVKRFSSWRIQ